MKKCFAIEKYLNSGNLVWYNLREPSGNVTHLLFEDEMTIYIKV